MLLGEALTRAGGGAPGARVSDAMLGSGARKAAAGGAGVRAGASFGGATRARFEGWIAGMACDDAAAARAAYADVHSAVGDLQARGYGEDVELLGAVEAALVAAMGHHDGVVREAAVVDLNVLYDGHPLQADEALPVVVACAGERRRVSVALSGGVDERELAEAGVVLRLHAPAETRDVPPTWGEVVVRVEGGSLVADLPRFACAGYYDWVVAESGGLVPAVDYVPVDTPRRLRGRFIVQPPRSREDVLVEVPVDEVGAVWDEQTGRLRSRGSFDAVRQALPALRATGATGLYLMGALERPPDDGASPFAAVDRARPATVLGGAPAFAALTAEVAEMGMKPIVDVFDRVSRTRMHRKYRFLTVETLNSKGIPVRHPGTDGRENQWEDTALLNYRRIETWNMMVAEVKTLAAKFGVRGVRLDNAQSLPPILAPNTEELFRKDPDGEPHYSLSEIFYGAVVKANQEFGYWTSDAGLDRGYPNPFLVKLCRELWNEYPDFTIIAESNFHREPSLLTSGAIVQSIRIPQILASVSGRSLRRDGTVVRIPPHKRSTARTLGRLLKNDKLELPKNAIMVGCTCTHLSPYPSVLYGRRAWLAVDLLFFLPYVPMQLLGEARGRAYRMNAAITMGANEETTEYDVNFDALLPKSPPKMSGQSSPAEGSLPSALSLTARGGSGSPLPGSALLSSPQSSSAAAPSGGVSPLTGLGGIGGIGGIPKSMSRGTLSAGTAPLGGLASKDANPSLAGVGLMRQTQSAQQANALQRRAHQFGSSGALSSQLPPSAMKKSKLKRRGSLADLRRPQGQTGLVRSRSRDDMQASSVKSISVDQYRRMSAIEEQVRQEIDPRSGFDISQIQGHYTHRSLLRQQIEALRVGDLCNLRVDAHLASTIFAFARYTDTEVVIVVLNFGDGREDHSHSGPANVEVDLRQLWDHLSDKLTNSETANSLFVVKDAITDDEHSAEVATLEEIVFRRYPVQVNPLSVVLLRLEQVDATEDMKREHFAHCVQRLQNAETFDLKDPRENSAVVALARGAAASVSEFAYALYNLRNALRNEGCDEDTTLRVLQLCIQRSSQLLFMVAYEGVPSPKDFDPPVAERIVAYLTHLSTACRDEGFMDLARSLVARSTKLGPLVFVTAELGRFSTAGGLGVMVDELTKGLAGLGLEVYVISPYYTVNRKNQGGYLGENIQWRYNVNVNLGTHEVECGVFEGKEHGVTLIFLERGDYLPKVYADPGSPSRHMQTVVLVSLGALEICCKRGLVPSLVVSNDWLPSMVSGYRNFFGPYFENTSFFHLIHNLGDGAYEGRCYPSPQEGALEHIHRLPRHLVMNDNWEQKVCNPSRTALLTTDNWGTVSPSYLKELCSGHPLGDLLQIAKLPFGYPNGIRKGEREQALRDKAAASHAEAKELLQKRYFKFETGDPNIPLFAFVGRITSQKGVHLILNAVEELIQHTGGKIQILVGGPANHADAYSAGCARHMYDLCSRHPWCFWAGPDDFFTDGPLVNLGADFGLMPSAFEPGGIVQQEFFVAGTPVVAFRTGGLKDTVHEWRSEELEGNGFTFEGYHHGDFVWAIKRALRVFGHPEEYGELRQSAYETVIDVSQVAWAWSSEFHRLRNACFTRNDVVCHAINASSNEDCDLFDPASKLVTIMWDSPGDVVILKGSFDGWMADWELQPPMADDGAGGGFELNGVDTSSGGKSLTLRLRPGKYMYKFKVDGEWVIAESQMKQQDEAGFTNNVVIVE